MTDPRARLLALVMRLDAPDLAQKLWSVRDVRELPHETREVLAEILGQECAARGMDADDRLNAYGREDGAAFGSRGWGVATYREGHFAAHRRLSPPKSATACRLRRR